MLVTASMGRTALSFIDILAGPGIWSLGNLGNW